MRILFIFTGGTIGSSVAGGYISPDDGAPSLLIKKYDERYGVCFEYDISMPFTMLSENSDGIYIYKLISAVKDAYENGGYDGIVVTHGTDTLTYSAAALSWALRDADIPVCIVSSDKPLEDESANGVDNLAGAVSLIKRSYECDDEHCRGILAPYRNHDGAVYIHRPLYLTEAGAFTDELFSLKNRYVMRFDTGKRILNAGPNYDAPVFDKDYAEHLDMKSHGVGDISDELTQTSEKILRIKAYPGMVYPEIREKVSFIIHETYHSGTVDTEFPGYREFFEEAAKRHIPVFMTGVSRGISYESTAAYNEMHVIPAYDISPSALYMRLWMAKDQEKR